MHRNRKKQVQPALHPITFKGGNISTPMWAHRYRVRTTSTPPDILLWWKYIPNNVKGIDERMDDRKTRAGMDAKPN